MQHYSLVLVTYFYASILSELLLTNGTLKKVGDRLNNTALANTLERIKNNASDFYTGSLARDVIDDIKSAKGIINMTDLQIYDTLVKPPVSYTFNDLKMYTMPAPGSGAVLAMILNIMHGKTMSRVVHVLSHIALHVFCRKPFSKEATCIKP